MVFPVVGCLVLSCRMEKDNSKITQDFLLDINSLFLSSPCSECSVFKCISPRYILWDTLGSFIISLYKYLHNLQKYSHFLIYFSLSWRFIKGGEFGLMKNRQAKNISEKRTRMMKWLFTSIVIIKKTVHRTSLQLKAVEKCLWPNLFLRNLSEIWVCEVLHLWLWKKLHGGFFLLSLVLW